MGETFSYRVPRNTPFATHGLEEAAYPAGSVIVMGANSGHFVDEFQLDFSRPGDRHSNNFDDVERRLGDLLAGSRTTNAVAAR
jgi:ABC-type nitrate/sulfonate/bicarbonate transport system ATPase subunit